MSISGKELIVKEKVAVHCETYEEAQILLTWAETEGIINNKSKLLSAFGIFAKNTCYDLSKSAYQRTTYFFEKGYIILKFSDINSEFETSPSADDFKKFDTEKPNLAILMSMPTALTEVSNVVNYGLAKYGRDNWKQAKKDDFERYESAILRHLLAYKQGEIIDTESGLPHLAHAATSLFFLLELTK